jgi:peptidyl-prolyl cis-trans isomerase D
MFKLMRSKAKFLYWFIAISFILFMGLTDMGGGGCKNALQHDPRTEAVGEVNGSPITRVEYTEFYRSLVQQLRSQSQTREVNANQYANAEQRAWDGLVRRKIMDQAIEDLKIEVTPEEIKARFENNPPFQILQYFRNQETGQVDMDAYYAALQNPEVDWAGFEVFVRDLIRSEKLQDAVTMDVTVSEDEVREEYINQTGQAVAEYIGVVFNNIRDDYEPSESEIEAWYNAHPEDFENPAKAECDVVRWKKTPSDTDYEELLQFMNEIREEILSGEKTFEEAAADYSDDNNAARGGDLGTFGRDRMGDEFTEAAFNLPVGELSQPVKTPFGYHLIEVLEQHNDEETGELFQVHARHILLKVTPSEDTLALIGDHAQAFADRVNGSNFVSTAKAEALDLLQPVPFAQGRDIPGLSLSLAGGNWAHGAKKGSVSRVFETNDYFYVLHAKGTIPAGLAPLDEVRSRVRMAVVRDRDLTRAKEMLNPAVGQVQMGKTMAEVAAGTELVHAVTDTFGANDNVLNVGYGTDFNTAALNGQVGTLIPEIETNRGVYALIPQWIKPLDDADYQSRRDGIQQALLARKQAEYLEEWLTEKEEAAEIKDRRYSL